MMWASGVFGYLLDYIFWWVLFLSIVAHTWCFFRFFPRKQYPRTALILGNALVFAVILGTVAIVAESYLRFYSVRTDAFGVSLPARRWFFLYTDLNSLGYRDREWEHPKPAGVRRIAFLGDSFTYGWGIKNPADRFGDQVAARLAAGVEGLNVAKPGWGTRDMVKPVIEVIERFGVDEVVYCHVPNDIEPHVPIIAEFDPTRPPEPRLINPDSSPLLDYLYRRVYLPRVPSVQRYFDWLAKGYADPQVWDMQKRSLTELIAACRERGVQLRVVLLPYMATNGEAFSTERVHRQVTDFVRSQGVETLNLAPATAGIPPGKLIVNALDPHPNEEAHRIFAGRIFEAFYASGAAVPGPE